MNPSSNEHPGLNLPPVSEQVSPISGAAESSPSAPEQQTAAPEQAPMHGQPVAAALPVVPAAPQLPATTAVPQDDVNATSQSAALPVNSDEDLIEKEWVNKAKAIVERNRDDPYKQSEELTVVKADYMQKRYGKTIKVNK